MYIHVYQYMYAVSLYTCATSLLVTCVAITLLSFVLVLLPVVYPQCPIEQDYQQ